MAKDQLMKVNSKEELSVYLKEKGSNHNIIRKYMPVSDYMCMIFNKTLFVSTGIKWNDKEDRKLMKDLCTFGTSMTYGKSENIAMWMLYSENHGKMGVLVEYPKSLLNDICNKKYELHILYEDGKCEVVNRNYYEAYMQDIIYYDDEVKHQVKLTHYKTSRTVPENFLIADGSMFYKYYAWSYEQECRLIVKLNEEKYKGKIDKNDIKGLVFLLDNKIIEEINKKTKVSPMSDVTLWKPSDYKDKVDWELK